MLKFKKFTDRDVRIIQKYTEKSPYLVCDISAGVLMMWNEIYNLSYAVYNETLILKTNFKNRFVSFFLPVGKDFDGALRQIERHAVETGIPLNFTCVEERFLPVLEKRYGKIYSEYHRDWSDYVYSLEEISTFAGKKFSGQRNHINGFKKTYKNYKFKKITPKTLPDIKRFLVEYQKEHGKMKSVEKRELKNTIYLLDNYKKGNFIGAYMEIDGKICSFTVGEYAGATLIIHIEKALKQYRGIYPATFNAFTNFCKKDGVIFINREDDSGDLGLRTSKTQYHPIMLVNKHFVSVKKPMKLRVKPTLCGNGITLSAITESDKQDYFDLYTNKSLNKYWGYDYKKDIQNPTPQAFFDMQASDFISKNNLCLAVRDGSGKMVGEAVLHNFDYNGEVEVGIRISTRYQHRGYGGVAVKLISDFAVKKGYKPVAKCYKQNLKSKACLERAGFILTSEDDKFFYLKKS